MSIGFTEWSMSFMVHEVHQRASYRFDHRLPADSLHHPHGQLGLRPLPSHALNIDASDSVHASTASSLMKSVDVRADGCFSNHPLLSPRLLCLLLSWSEWFGPPPTCCTRCTSTPAFSTGAPTMKDWAPPSGSTTEKETRKNSSSLFWWRTAEREPLRSVPTWKQEWWRPWLPNLDPQDLPPCLTWTRCAQSIRMWRHLGQVNQQKSLQRGLENR